jgi:DNA modification methylase
MTGKAQFIIGDSIQVLSAWTGDSIQTTIFDPPYNVGFDYGPGGHQDKLPDQEYQELIFELAHASFNVSKDSASFFMVHYPEATARLLPVLERAGWTFHQWISWVYPTNLSSLQLTELSYG